MSTEPYTGTLTPEHTTLITTIRDEWMRAALSTQPASRQEAETAARNAYTAAGLPTPPVQIWMDSPIGAIRAAAMISQPGDPLRPQLWGQLWGRLRGQFRERLGNQFRERLGNQLGNQLWDQLGNQLGDQLGKQLWGQLWDELGNADRGALRGSLGTWIDPYWMALHQCTAAIVPLPAHGRLDAVAAAVRSCGWWIPLRGASIMAGRPVTLRTEAPGLRLHCPDGPAIEWADGYALHAWHGTRVPPSLISGDWDLTRILREPNSEIRRCAIEKTGWDRLESQLGAPVACCPDPGNPGRTLALYDAPDGLYDTPVRLVLMTNGSPDRSGAQRRYGETVAAEISDPLTAQAWAYGIPAETYAAAQRRT